MKCNVAVMILREMCVVWSESGFGRIRASKIRREFDIPVTTFYRHLRNLIAGGLIEQVGHGIYRPTYFLIHAMEEASKDRQLDMPF